MSTDLNTLLAELARTYREMPAVERAIHDVRQRVSGATGLLPLDSATTRQDVESHDPAVVLIREIERLRELVAPQWWFAPGGEYQYEDWSDAVRDRLPDHVEKVEGITIVEVAWVATACLSVDDNGDPDETEERKFATEAEARRCWPESLAAARAALGEDK